MKTIFRLTCILAISGISFFSQAQNNKKDPYLTELYDQLHLTERQKQFKKIRPMPAGVVYIQHHGEGEKEMREHFRLMKELGFTCLKGIMSTDGWSIEDIQLIALDEGLIPWWYDQGGWQPITDELLKELGISRKLSIQEIREHPKMQAHQKEVLRQRILRMKEYKAEHGRLRTSSAGYDADLGGRGIELTPEGEALFLDWVESHYQTIDSLNFAWNLRHAGLGEPFTSWVDFRDNWKTKVAHREYRNKMDILRFKAEYRNKSIEEKAQMVKAYDPWIPYRQGGEMGLFLPFAYMGVNMEGIAEVAKNYGSFYPSTHLSWHFNESENEIVRPFYMQASMMNDYYKGGWTGGWESTGGPQQYDGEKYASRLNSYFVDGGTVLQLFMSQMAAGFKGFGIWCWSVREGGKEGGEYSLLDRNNQVTDRAIKLGKMAKAMQKYRDEIWMSHKEPLVGVYTDWNNDATWAAMSVRGRDYFREVPTEARIGVNRALIDANVPYEYVTKDDLLNGLADRYRIIYLPSIISLDKRALATLEAYVSRGGRVVIDLPGGKYDEFTTLLPTGKGSTFEKLFGITLDNFQFSGTNQTRSLNDTTWTGLVADVTPTSANVLARYDNEKAAITENSYGKGTAVFIGLDMSHQCFRPGFQRAQDMLIEYTLGSHSSPYSCEDAIVYRLSNADSDFYFFINDGEAKTVALKTDYSYKKVIDAITGEEVSFDQVSLESDDARWLRAEK